MIVLLFGAPGVGKGTNAQLLSERKNLPHLSTGNAFREAITQQTPVGVLAKSYIDKGHLVPDEVVNKIVEETLIQPAYAQGCILDGYPRTLPQAHSLDQFLKTKNKEINAVINIDVAHSEIVDRMIKRGRKDDTQAIISERLKVYENETAPLLEYYTKQGKLTSIDGNAPVETVYQKIVTILGSISLTK